MPGPVPVPGGAASPIDAALLQSLGARGTEHAADSVKAVQAMQATEEENAAAIAQVGQDGAASAGTHSV